MAGLNAAVVRKVIESVWNQGDLDVANTLIDTIYVNHGGIISDLTSGPEAIKVSVALLRAAFPDFHVTIDHLTAKGNQVDVRWTATSGTRLESSATAGLSGTTRSTLTDGKIVESWTEWDCEGTLRSLGISIQGN